MKRLSLLILLLLLICMALTSCYDAMEIDDDVFVLTLGIDKGVYNRVRITVQYPVYKSEGGGGEDQKKPSGGMGKQNKGEGVNTHTIEASSILEGIDLFNTATARTISLQHTKMLIMSEDFAREGIGDYLSPIARYRETRRTMLVAVVKGRAEDFIRENASTIGESASKSIELMSQQSKKNGFFPVVSFHQFYKGIISTYGETFSAYAGLNDFKKLEQVNQGGKSPLITEYGALPGDLPRNGVDKREFLGVAVFRGDRMIGALNSYETRYFLMVTGKFNRGIITLEDKLKSGSVIPFEVRLGRRPKIKGYYKNGKPVIDIKLAIEADIGSIQSRINYENVKMIGKLNDQLKDHIQKGISKMIEKTQKDLKADIFEFGTKFAGYYPTIQEWEKYNWLKHYPEAKVNLDVEVNVRRTGLMIKSSPIIDPYETTQKEGSAGK